MSDLARQVNTLQDELAVTKQAVDTKIVDLKSELVAVQTKKRTVETQEHSSMDEVADFSKDDKLEEELLRVTQRLEGEQSRRRQLEAELVDLQTQMDQIQIDSLETTQELIEKAGQVQRAQDEVRDSIRRHLMLLVRWYVSRRLSHPSRSKSPRQMYSTKWSDSNYNKLSPLIWLSWRSFVWHTPSRMSPASK